MLWEIHAAEDLKTGDFVEFIADLNGVLSCKKTAHPEAIAAMAARDITKGELLTYDTADDTQDLLRVKDPFSRT
jgi:predicted transcriptional regulator